MDLGRSAVEVVTKSTIKRESRGYLPVVRKKEAKLLVSKSAMHVREFPVAVEPRLDTF